MGNPNAWKTGFGQRPKEVDDEYRSRCKGVLKQRTWTKDRCIDELNDILDAFKLILRTQEKLNKDNPTKLKQENIRDLTSMMNRILDFMKYLYPPTQTNVNLNIDMTANAVVERLKEWKKKSIASILEVKTGENEEKNC